MVGLVSRLPPMEFDISKKGKEFIFIATARALCDICQIMVDQHKYDFVFKRIFLF